MTKLIGILTMLGLVDIGAQSLTNSNDLLFLFISNNKLVSVGRILLAALVLSLAYRQTIKYRVTYRAAVLLCLVLIIFPIMTIIDPNIAYYSYGVFKPLDYIVSLDLGLVLAACLLETNARNQRFAVNNLSTNKLRLHVPKVQPRTVLSELGRAASLTLFHSAVNQSSHPKTKS